MTDTNLNRFLALMLSAAFVISGCQQKEKKTVDKKLIMPDARLFETTLGNMADIYQTGAFNVESYGLVVNLNGTGSSECEPYVRSKLIKLIQKQLKTQSSKEANDMINSMDTAVVYIRGVIPALAVSGETFDLQVIPLPGTQTTSLESGRLYTVDLTQNANVDYAKTVAYADGPIFVNKVSEGAANQAGYYILGGGKVIDDAPLSLWLKEPNYYTSNAIRNRINERFGRDIARAVSPEEVQITFPKKYLKDKIKYLAMIEQLYLGTDPVLTQRRIDMLAERLVNETGKFPAEIALETIGNACVKTVKPLIDSDDPDVRFNAGRCLMNLGDQEGLALMKDLAYTRASKYRLAAIESIGSLSSNNEANKILNDLLSDSDRSVVFAAYRALRDKNSFAVTRKLIGGDFLVENVISNGSKTIYVSRSETPRIVLFGFPIDCNPDLFVKSDDGNIVITAESGNEYVSLMRKHPTRPTLIGPFKSTYSVSDVVRTLGEIPRYDEDKKTRAGLGVPYSEIILLLERMCSSNMIDAEFVAGPMTEVKVLRSVRQESGN